MPADVIDADERDAQSVGKPLCKGKPHEERAQKSRAVRHGNGVELLLSDARRGERARDDLVHRLGVGA